jgi:hypothetical protein
METRSVKRENLDGEQRTKRSEASICLMQTSGDQIVEEPPDEQLPMRDLLEAGIDELGFEVGRRHRECLGVGRRLNTEEAFDEAERFRLRRRC